jgi:hypothetical protein
MDDMGVHKRPTSSLLTRCVDKIGDMAMADC